MHPLFVCLSRLLLASLLLGVILGAAGCSRFTDSGDPAPGTSESVPPTPNSEALRISSEPITGSRLRITLTDLELLKRDADAEAQIFVLLADDQGAYAYLLYPANRAGDASDTFALTTYPLDLGISDETRTVTLWVLALHNWRYTSAESFGIDALASSLAVGFRSWLRRGDPQDDPLAAVVSASDGALYEWFAGIEVLGQGLVRFAPDEGWPPGEDTLTTADGGIVADYTIQVIPSNNTVAIPSGPTPVFPTAARAGYALAVDETFAGGVSAASWYEGSDSTYTNEIVDGAYEIKLRDIQDRGFARSWGSIEERQFTNYTVEAQVRLLEQDAQTAEYGLWLHYQDDYNFIYFGISNNSAYRVAVVQQNQPTRELQPWTVSDAIQPGAATNILTAETTADGDLSLYANGVLLGTFHDEAFTGGSVAFFCYAESVPTTCQLERIRIWQARSSATAPSP
ncbi:MAG TPA: hypothetical protein PKD09_06265 [Aggregatilinea sp.]|uniref:hypothetical protein n=1 Tax=Aggregatilinea sp. TaxID=2806333 RepID=UPI002CF4F0A3|nr:hypothetical protein [Aggregatilinea sp.]HML21230.1 hypothetical protein [Aggregatilinea sp.]